MKLDNVVEKMEVVLKREDQVDLKNASSDQIHRALGMVVMGAIADNWYESRHAHERTREAFYFSAEYLMGRMVYNNLFSLGILEDVKKQFKKSGIDITVLEDIEDAALGNGGLGRLAACFLDSGATMNLPLSGYGLRYKYGLFKQSFENGFQVESADDWQHGDPWERRRDAHEIIVSFANQSVRAIPYDMPIVGYGTDNVGTLRLWQSEPMKEFDFKLFNDQEYGAAVLEKNAVEDITRVLYPNDSTKAGKQLRLKQQYFLSSASLQDILVRYKRAGRPIDKFAEYTAIQLNDTHPTVSIPELMRLLMKEGIEFNQAFEISRNTFSYTNHTVMQEALEKWDVNLFKEVLPEIFNIIYGINVKLCGELMNMGKDCSHMSIIQENLIHMANLAVYGSHAINGVAAIHTEILKNDVLREWYDIYPDRFQNKTNGITQRRWLGLCNPELSKYISKRTGSSHFMLDLDQLKVIRKNLSDEDIKAFNKVKHEKKEQLAKYIAEKEGIIISPDFIFDVQVKRLHEYKRQLMNAFAIMDIYFGIKEGRITDFTPTVFIFGAKAAPGYLRAKAIIKYIHEIGKMINSDPDMQEKMKVVYVQNYNCSYAEHIIPAADISEQISPAGTEASGTGNMKLMLNGAVTLGTYDGANIEIVEKAGEENNYIFGKRVNEINEIKNSYNARALYEYDTRIRKVVDTLIDGTFTDNNTGVFADLYRSLVEGNSWDRADKYYILLELIPYIERKLQANKDYKDRIGFGKKCLANIAAAGPFSSDRTIKEYAKDIWNIKPIKVKQAKKLL